MRIYLCTSTNTFRSRQENIWLASLKHDSVIFDSWDKYPIKFKNDEVQELWNKICQIRYEHKSLKRLSTHHSEISGLVVNRYAIIAETNGNYGVQFWLDVQIKNGKSTNTDGSISYFVARL